MPLTVDSVEQLSLVRQFEGIVAENPQAVAVVHGDRYVSYQALNEQVNQLAHLLINEGLSQQTIGISGQSKYQMLLCQLAIMKANSTFVVFDSKDPDERVVFIAKNAEVTTLLHCGSTPLNPALAGSIPGNVLVCNEPEIMLSGYSKDNPSVPSDKTSPAYLLYTSGSTANQPKGVVQLQQNIVHQIRRYTHDLELSHQDRFLQLATLSHDQAIVDIYAALLNGATLVLVDNQLDAASILATVKNEKISVFSSIPSMFSLIFGQANANEFPDLRIITIGGEETTLAHAALFQRIASPHSLLINGYGATECSWVSSFTVDAHTDLSQFKSFPLGNLTEGIAFIVDRTDYDVGGELLIHGDGVSPGYWNNEAEKDKAFVVIEGKTYYRTGDIVSPDDQGCFHFLGRAKWHEKIRGQRVNTKEIEDTFLKQLPGTECVVIAVGEGMDKKLVLFVAGHPDGKESRLEKIKAAMPGLSDYMAPSHVVDLADMPYLANGKINRNALKERFLASHAASSKPAVEKERSGLWPFIENLWRQTLSLSVADDDATKEKTFLELGGNSLQAMSLSRGIQRYFEKYHVYMWLPVERVMNQDLIEIKRQILDVFESKKYTGDTLVGGERPQSVQDFNALVRMVNDEQLGYLSYVADDYFSLIMNYAAMCVVADYYNKKYDILITPCRSYQQFTDEVVAAVSSGNKPLKRGLTWPQDNDKDEHPVPCLLFVDEDGLATLVISDSLGQNNEYAAIMREHLASAGLTSIRIVIDQHQRQTDFSSCSIDALCYLKNTLRSDFLNRADIDDTDVVRNNPPEAMKTWQRELPDDLDLSQRFFNRPEKTWLLTMSDTLNRFLFFRVQKGGLKKIK